MQAAPPEGLGLLHMMTSMKPVVAGGARSRSDGFLPTASFPQRWLATLPEK